MKMSFVIYLSILFTFQLQAQEEHQFEFDHVISSKAFGDDRKITVYLPPSYYKYPDSKFTVTYVLDGHFDPFIDLGVKTIEYNTYTQKYTPTIVVGIHAKARGWEFSAPIPGDEDDENYKGGRAPELQQHFRNEIFPLIDSLYKRTLPFRSIVGHSSGGAFVLYSLFSDQKDLFDGYLAISPGIREDSEYILEMAVAKLESGEAFHKFLYCSSGTVGEREELFGGAVDRLDSIFQSHPNHGLIWKKSKFEGMGHWTCVGPSFNIGMVELTRAFRVDEQMFYDFADNQSQSMTTQLETFYKNRKDNYGFVDVPSPGYIYQVAWWISDQENNQAALELYEWGLKQHLDNYKLTKSKGKLLLKMGKKKEATSTFKKCLVILESLREKFGEENYADQKEYLNKKIKAAAE